MSVDALVASPLVDADRSGGVGGGTSDTEGMTSRSEQWITAFIVGTPFLVLVFGVIWFWGEGIHLHDVVIATVLYLLIGHGITIGYHRLLAHKSFHASATSQAAARRRWFHGVRGRPDRVGRRSSASSRVLGSTR